MKKNIYTCLLIVLLSSMLHTIAKAANTKDSTCLEICGKISKLNNKLTNSYQVELIHQNKVMDIIQVKDSKSFSFILQKNTLYTIRISKKGFVPRFVTVDTKLPPENNLFYFFQFETELITESDSKILDQEALEFPIAIIAYHMDVDWFYFNEEYTSNIKRGIYGKEYTDVNSASNTIKSIKH